MPERAHRASIAVACALTATACTHRTQPDFPVGDDVQTIVFIVEHEGQPPAAYAVGDELNDYPVLLDEGARVTALLYTLSAETLQIELGPVATASDPASGRSLPAAPAFVREATMTSWQATSTIPPILLPPLDAWRCARQGGCVDDAGERCEVPCIVDVPMAPQPPDPPAPLALTSTRTCAAPWTRVQDSEVVVCQPPPWLIVECPIDQMQLVYEDHCERIDTDAGGAPRTAACGANADLIDPSAYLINAPDDFDAALLEADAHARAGERVVIALGEREYLLAANATISGDITVLGACVAGSTIHSDRRTLTLSGGSLRLWNLHAEQLQVDGIDGGSVTLTGARLDDSRVRVFSSNLLADHVLSTGQLIARDGSITVTRTQLGESGVPRVRTLGALFARDASASMSRVSVIERGFSINGGSGTLEDVFTHAEPTILGTAGITDGATVHAERMVIGGASLGIDVRDGAVFDATDIEVHGFGASGTGVYTRSHGQTTLIGARIESYQNCAHTSTVSDSNFNDVELFSCKNGLLVWGTGRVSRASIHDMTQAGVLVDKEGSLAVHDLEVKRTQEALSSLAGLEVERAHVSDNLSGILIQWTGSATITDALLENNLFAASADFGGRLVLDRLIERDNIGTALYVSRNCAYLQASNVEIIDTVDHERTSGVVFAEHVNTLLLDRVLMENVDYGAMQIEHRETATATCTPAPTEIRLRDVSIVAPKGRGLSIDVETPEIAVNLERVSILGAWQHGIELLYARRASFHDLSIVHSAGAGVRMAHEGELSIERFLLSNNNTSGVELDAQIEVGTSGVPLLRLRNGAIEGSPRGIQLRGPATLDSIKELDGVAFIDVGAVIGAGDDP